jgi:hypothetical protein
MNSWVLAGTLLAFVSVSQGVDPGDDLGNNLNSACAALGDMSLEKEIKGEKHIFFLVIDFG